MNKTFLLSLLVTLVAGGYLHHNLQADEVLFIGNSYTYGANAKGVEDHGGVPALVAAIARSKGHGLSPAMLVAGGKNWKYHLDQPETSSVISSKKWKWIVMQDLSVEPTHIGDIEIFKKTGNELYQKIRELDPQATIVLYETWARQTGNELYAKESTAKTFVNPAEMTSELVKNYGELEKSLEDRDPGPQVKLAPVGAAFARSLELYPDIILHSPDKHHASAAGYYLSALVFYGTLYNDSPVGATNQFPGVTIEPDQAAKLQKVAEETLQSLAPPKP